MAEKPRAARSLGRGARHWTGGAVGYLLAGWNLGSIFGIRAGAPVNVVMQRTDIAFVDASGQEVAAGTPGAFPVLHTPQGGGAYPYLNQRLNLFNPLAFSVPQRWGNGDTLISMAVGCAKLGWFSRL